MTPISHAATGLAIGGILSPILKKFFQLPIRATVAISFIAGIMPDIDSVSLLFSHSIYYGKYWYSHHMAAHSLLLGAAFSALVAFVYITFAIFSRGIRNLIRRDKIPLESRILRTIGAFIVAFAAYSVHLLGDLITPPGPWGGIAMMWPSTKMYGGWDKVYWHNWYLIYISIVFMISFVSIQLPAGILSSIRYRYVKWAGYSLQAAAVIICLVYGFKMYGFINTHDFKKMGFNKWDAMNRSMVPAEYMKNSNRYLEDATIFWRKNILKKEDMLKILNGTLAGYEKFYHKISPVITAVYPSFRSADYDMKAYRYLQRISKGMEDKQPGDYRLWILRDIYPQPEFYNKGFLFYYIAKTNTYFVQMTNAWMIVFRIDKRDNMGNAVKVTRVFHSDKIFVPDSVQPQLNPDILKSQMTFHFWRHDKIPYNIVPRLTYSRHMNLIKGLYPSLNTDPGYVWPGYKTGIAIHDGAYSEGCTVHCFFHTDIGSHFQYPYFQLWKTADEVIDNKKLGSAFRGKNKVWGRALFVKNPNLVEISKL